MADSIQEQIVKKVAQALSEITVANGYNNTIQSVQRGADGEVIEAGRSIYRGDLYDLDVSYTLSR